MEIRPKEIHKTTDLLPKMEDKQQLFVMTVESESMSPAEDGVADARHTEKLPEPGSTLVEYAILDKSPVSIIGS